MKKRRLARRIIKRNNFFRFLSVIFLILIICIVCYLIQKWHESSYNKEIYNSIIVKVNESAVGIYDSETENMKKVQKLKNENEEIVGWIQINDSIIDYPILQTNNDEYYLTHNYKKDKTKYGSIFLNSSSNLYDVNSNLIIYGHNMEDGQMFTELLNYKSKEYYDSHNKITISTNDEENEYVIISVFKSRVFFEDEKDVFRYYNYTKFHSIKEYDEFINNCKALSLYDTGITAKYGEQLVTLVTCEYSQKNGRMVIIAKKI